MPASGRQPVARENRTQQLVQRDTRRALNAHHQALLLPSAHNEARDRPHDEKRPAFRQTGRKLALANTNHPPQSPKVRGFSFT